MKALYLALAVSALFTAYAPNITVASDHLSSTAVQGAPAQLAATQAAFSVPASPAVCMIIGASQAPGAPYTSGVAMHVYNLVKPLPVNLQGRMVLGIGRKFIPLNVTRTGTGSIISFIDERELTMITAAMQTSTKMQAAKARPAWQDVSFETVKPSAVAMLSCANTTAPEQVQAQIPQSYQ